MKKWILIIVVVLVALIVIGVLYEAGYLNFKWQTLTCIFAALAGPYTFIKNKLFNNNNVDSIQELINKAKNGMDSDAEHRSEYDAIIADKEAKIDQLNNRLSELDAKTQNLEQQAANVSQEVRQMNSEEMAIAFEQLYGNLKDE